MIELIECIITAYQAMALLVWLSLFVDIIACVYVVKGDEDPILVQDSSSAGYDCQQ